jgi:NAD(P)-dependent dehydrogenase (short-subunit alcohol dehydrogenase family)
VSISFDLEDKVVMVTGASKGIGRVIALACAEAGADLALGARNVEGSRETAEACRALGRRAEAWPLDVTDLSGIEGFVASVTRAFGRIDVLVNNAGVIIVKPSVEVGEDEFDQIVDVNFKGAFFTGTAVARAMIERGTRGRVINISSQSGHIGAPLRAVYAGSKGALNQLTRTWAAEWAPHGITVNGVSPTFTRSDMLTRSMQNPQFRKNLERVPLGRPAEPEEVAAAVIYLASAAAAIVTGHTILVDGGFTIV